MQSFIVSHGYLALFLLAVLSSACIPVPSEVAFAYGGYLCTTAGGGAHPLTIVTTILVGSLGSLVGSEIAYEVGRYAGRPIVDKWGKWILLSHKDLDYAEHWFACFGDVSVFVGRIVPVIRTVISFPAGVAEMRRGRFLMLSAIGSVLWVTVLTYLGRDAGKNWSHVSHTVHQYQTPIIALCVLIVVAFYVLRFRAVRRESAN